MSSIKVNSIVENTADNGVTVDGVLLKDGGINIDSLSEKTSGSGVTIDGALIKDGLVASSAGGSLVRLASATASDSSELTFDNFVDQDTYISYQIYFQNIKAANDSNNLRVKFRDSDGDVTGTYRQGGAYYYGDATQSAFFNNNSSTDYQTLENNVGNNNSEALVGKADFYPATGTAESSSVTVLNSVMSNQDNTDRVRTIHRGTYFESGATEVNGIKFYLSSGNISSGSIVVYGVKK